MYMQVSADDQQGSSSDDNGPPVHLHVGTRLQRCTMRGNEHPTGNQLHLVTI